MILVWLAAAWLAGIASAATFGAGAWPLALALCFALVAVAVVRRAPRIALFAVVLPAIFTAGVWRFELAGTDVAADDVSRLNDGVAMRVRGVLRDDPTIADTSQRFAVTIRAVEERGEWQTASGGVLVTTALLPRYVSGDVVELEGKLETPASTTGFDYADYLAGKGIGSTIGFPRVKVAGHEDDGIVRSTILHVRRRLSHALELSLPEPQASLAQGVLLGEKSALPRDVADDLNTTNTSHLVVVSGSNVVLVSANVTLALAWIVGRRRAMALSIAAIVAYAMLVGASPPVMRAAIMGILLVFARLSGRPSDGIVSIVVAAAIMAGLNPHVARDVSFQLSFAATAGIVFLASPLRAWIIDALARLLRREQVPHSTASLVDPLAVTLAAIIATQPLIALYFGRVSLVAIPANVLVVPAFGAMLLASLVAAICGLIPHAHLAGAAFAYYALTYWLVIARWLASVPAASVDVSGFTSAWAALAYTGIASAIWLVSTRAGRPLDSALGVARGFDMNARRIAMAAVPGMVLAMSAAFVLWPSQPPRLKMTVLDIGQGDAILLRTPGGRDILVDGGPGPAVVRGLSNELPWYDRDIELVVMTHPQADHVTGLLDVLARYDVKRILVGPGVEASVTYHAWQTATRVEGVDPEIVSAGMSFDAGDGVRIDVLGPDAAEGADTQINNTGAVLRVSWRNVSFLLTADIEARAERALIADNADLRATVLKVPHHGSATSSTTAFLDAVRPAVAVISAGKDNRFGLPVPDVVSRLQGYSDVYSTADTGPIEIETDGARLWVNGRETSIEPRE